MMANDVPTRVAIVTGGAQGIATTATEAVQRYAASFPVAGLGEAGEVASLVAFLASDEAAYINGGDLTI